MSASKVIAVLLVLLTLYGPGYVYAQGFSGLGSDAQGFAVPTRGVDLSFPKDHGPHDDFRIEWWYVTANLQTADGRRLGAQWTLFRSALKTGRRQGWSDPQIWIGHAAVTTAERHHVAERLGRGGVGQAGVIGKPFEAWIDNWQMAALPGNANDQLDRMELRANGQDFDYRLTLTAQAPLVLQGDRGYSVKSSSGQASYYYSQPFYTVQGMVTLDGSPVAVTGKAWLDREWSSQPLASSQTGWDWFSLHLGSGEKLMAFRLRDAGGDFISGNWIDADGKTMPLSSSDIIVEPVRKADVNGRAIPVAWRLKIPSRGLDVTTQPLNEQAWMTTSTPYWEGPVSFEGSVSGEGYLEMTGY